MAEGFHFFRLVTLSGFVFCVTECPEKESCYLEARSSRLQRAVPGTRPVREITATVLAGLVHGARGVKVTFTWNSAGIARETELLREIQHH